jgi:hypothetical protein
MLTWLTDMGEIPAFLCAPKVQQNIWCPEGVLYFEPSFISRNLLILHYARDVRSGRNAGSRHNLGT